MSQRFIPLLCKSVMQHDWSGCRSKSFTAVTTNPRPRMEFSLWLKPGFSWTSISCFHGFSRAPTEKVPSSLNEGRRQGTRIISNDDSVFNFIYSIKMKEYIVKTARSLRAE